MGKTMTTIGKSFGGTAVDTILSDPVKFAENLRKAQSAINEKVKPNGDFDLFSYQTELPPMTAEEQALEAEENDYINEIDIEADVGEEERARRVAERARRIAEVDAKRDARYLDRLNKSISAAAFDDQNLLLVARGGANLQVSTYGENPSGKTVNLFAIGSTGHDALIGAGGNDVLFAGGNGTIMEEDKKGKDYEVVPGDVLKGGGGSDTFIVGKGVTFIHNLSETSSIFVPFADLSQAEIAVFSPFYKDPTQVPDPDNVTALDLGIRVTLGDITFVVNFNLEEINKVLGRTFESIVEAWGELKEADWDMLVSYIGARTNSSLPAQQSTQLANTQEWNHVFGKENMDVRGTMGRDSIFGKGKGVTLRGFSGGDNFHVKAGMGTIIADFNFHQRDRIVMDDVKLADFKKELVRVERSAADFIVRYNGNIIAKLLNYEGMPRTNAPAKIRELVTGS